MKKITLFTFIICLLISVNQIFAQQTGYYNNTDGKSGDDLKTALYHIIKDHQEYSYFSSKTVFKMSDADPNNPENVILVYTGRSQSANTFGNGNDDINREHVWAKSHGGFGTEPPMGSDFHNLKPADHSVNVDRSNLDFDNGGNPHSEATGCAYDGDSWEARDEVKGDIARILFYMATRYEGENGEDDLKLVDNVDSYPAPEHGKLSTLLEWSRLDPPDDFERNRNNVIFKWQRNRNPFIDNPEFADLIWDNATPSSIIIDDIAINGEINAENPTQIQATITHTDGTITSAKIYYGIAYDNLVNSIDMTADASVFSAYIPPHAEGNYVYYKIVAEGGGDTHESVVYNYYVPAVFNGTLVSIYDIQGQTNVSPMADQIVDASGTQNLDYGEISTTGIVTGIFGEKYFMQDGKGEWNGIMIYDPLNKPAIGDSIIVTGIVKEYYTMTEITDVSGYYHISADNVLPEPVLISTGGAQEKYEGVLVKVEDATCTDADYQNNHYMWEVNDGSGKLFIHNGAYEYAPSEGLTYNITGPLNFDFGEFKIELRYEADVNTNSGTDTEPPYIQTLNTQSETRIEIFFNEKVDKETAENKNNYSIDKDVVIESVYQHLIDEKRVFLKVNELTPNTHYTLNVKRVKDLNGNAISSLDYEFGYLTGIEEYIHENTLKLSPIPTKDGLTLSYKAKTNANMSMAIYTYDGKLIQQMNYCAKRGKNDIFLDVSGFEKGFYFIQLQFENEFVIRKFVKN